MVLLFVPCGVDSLRILEKEKQAVEKGERREIGIGDESPKLAMLSQNTYGKIMFREEE